MEKFYIDLFIWTIIIIADCVFIDVRTFDFTNNGPDVDETGSATKHFAYINAGSIPYHNNTSTIEMPMLNAIVHMIECFHFWFSIKVIKVAPF